MEALQSFLDSPFVKQYGPLGIAFLGSMWLIWYYTARLFPRMNQTWANQISAEREANNKRADEDRVLFRQIHEESVRASTARHEEARGWHEKQMDAFSTIYGKLDGIDEKLPESESESEQKPKRRKWGEGHASE